MKRTKARGANPCKGNCGRKVSANKLMCVFCLARAAQHNLKRQGVEVEQDDLRRFIRDAAGA